jgi:hypothetical protein
MMSMPGVSMYSGVNVVCGPPKTDTTWGSSALTRWLISARYMCIPVVTE